MSDADNKASADKRKDKRVSLIQEIECEGDAGTFRRRLADISYGGMFIDTLTAFAPGSLIKIRFRIAGSDHPIEVTGKVLYVQDKIGTGVQFQDLKPEDRVKIGKLIENLSSKKRAISGEAGRSSRVLVNIPISLQGTDNSGAAFEEQAMIITLAKHGARIRTNKELDVEMKVFLHIPNGAQYEARIVWVGDDGQRAKGEIGIQCRGLAHALGFNFP